MQYPQQFAPSNWMVAYHGQPQLQLQTPQQPMSFQQWLIMNQTGGSQHLQAMNSQPQFTLQPQWTMPNFCQPQFTPPPQQPIIPELHYLQQQKCPELDMEWDNGRDPDDIDFHRNIESPSEHSLNSMEARHGERMASLE